MVEGSISFISTPPAVTMPSSIGLNPLISNVKFLIKLTKFFLSSFVISFTFLVSEIPESQ